MGERLVHPAPMLLRLQPTHSAAWVGRALVQLFDAVGGLPCKVSWVQRETERQLVDDADPALADAARTLAEAIDAAGDLQDRQPYHGRQHFCEVMLVASVLCQVHRLTSRPAQLLLLAALMHDFQHDGDTSRNFRLERASIERATPYLVAAGVGAPTRLRLAALVLATEPHHGVCVARQARDFHVACAPLPPRLDGAAELGLLHQDEELSHLAMLLCEADVLPSAGLTHAHAMRLQGLLAREWGQALGPAHKLAFLDDVLASGVIGLFFRPNVAAIHRQVARRADGPR